MTDLDRFWPATVEKHPELRKLLECAYEEPHRGYHNTLHLFEVFTRIEQLVEQRDTATALPREIDLDAVLLGAWFHDAVYDPAGDNEERSAVLAATTLTEAGLPPALIGEVSRLVRVTATHQVAGDDLEGQVLCDADLGILAADDARYADYTEGVRREYAHVSDEDFRRGRAHVLRNLLEAPRLFNTEFARRHWEQRARTNVTRELATLEI